MSRFPSVELLNEEYNEGLLDANGLRPYIDNGCLTQDQYNQMVSKAPNNKIF